MNNDTVRLPEEDQPINKARRHGASILTTSELLSLLLNPCAYTAQPEAVKLAAELVTLRDILALTEEQARVFGLSKADIARLAACAEIGKRYRSDEARKIGKRISSSSDAAAILTPLMRDLKIELFKVVYLDSKNRILEIVDSAPGTVDRAFPIVREIFKKGLELQATMMICAHNHPSGDPAPSREDTNFTKELHEAGKIMSIRMIDHLIIGDNRYYSFADEGEI